MNAVYDQGFPNRSQALSGYGAEPEMAYYDPRQSPRSPTEQWPLPPPSASDRSPRIDSPVNRSPHLTQQRPARRKHHDADMAYAYQQPYPRHERGPQQHLHPSQRSHHNYGQWGGQGYMPPPSGYAPHHDRRTPRAKPNASTQHYAPDGRMRGPNLRSPHALPYSARRDYHGNYHHAPQQQWHGQGSRHLQPYPPGAQHQMTGAHVPSYYFEDSEQDHAAEGSALIQRHDRDVPEQQAPFVEDADLDTAAESRQSPEFEPMGMIRQASLGKQARPTLMNVGGSAGATSGATLPPPTEEASAPEEAEIYHKEEVIEPPGAWISDDITPDSEEGDDDRSLNRGVAPSDPVEERDIRRRSSTVLGSDVDVVLREDTSMHSIDSPQNVQNDRFDARPPAQAQASDSSIETTFDTPTPTPAPIEHRISRPEPLAFNTTLAPTLMPTSPASPSSTLRSPPPAFSARASARTSTSKTKPTDLTIDVSLVQSAEARGSMTSLSDLIKRATKLASNLDRGKTASRLGLDFFGGGTNASSEVLEKLRGLQDENSDRRSRDLLGAGTQGGARGSTSGFSSMLSRGPVGGGGEAGDGEKRLKQGRRCCGMPLWAFVLIIVVLVLLVAAAVVVPVVLLVLPQNGK